MKTIVISIIMVVFSLCTYAQNDKEFPMIDMTRIETKNYFFTALLNQIPEFKEMILSDRNLCNIHKEKQDRLEKADSVAAFVDILKFSDEEISRIEKSISQLCKGNPQKVLKIRQMLDKSLCYGFDSCSSNDAFLKKVWRKDAEGMNRAIDIYGNGKSPYYPKIDSISFDVRSKEFAYFMLAECKQLILKKASRSSLFFEIPLSGVNALLDINDRLQSVDFEPIIDTENKPSLERIKNINWNLYDHTVILVLGAGPEIEGQRISTIGRLRASYGALLYNEGKAPFIMLSGGRVHPYHTPFCEAEEMKKYLMQHWGIPENAIIIDPWARHTTTNLRNTSRMIYRMGIPSDKTALVTSSEKHIDSVCSPQFEERCYREMKVIPFRSMKRISERTAEFYPIKEAFLMNPDEPMDP